MLLRLNSWLRPVRSVACFCRPPREAWVACFRRPSRTARDRQVGESAKAWHPAKARQLAAVCSLIVSLAVGGCARDDATLGKVVSVSGRVLVNGEPLKGKKGAVTFIPHNAKGNTATVTPTGTLDDNGTYTLYYAEGKKGAPLGWYKVQVSATKLGPGIQMVRKKMKGAPPPPPSNLPFDVKFTNIKTSGLEVEVVESPASGAYDLKLTK